MRSQKLTTIILIGMVLGILVGWACHTMWPDPKTAKTIADYISLITDIFLRLIKMIIAPLVFSTLVVGIAHMGDTEAVGRVGVQGACCWFVSASLVSLLARPGAGQPAAAGRRPGPAAARRERGDQPQGARRSSLKDFVTHLVPTLDRRRHGDQRDPADRGVLAVLRRCLRRDGRPGQAAGRRHRASCRHVMLKVTGYVMKLAPLAVFAAMAAIDHREGARHPRHLRQVHRRVLSRARACCGSS